MALRVVNYSDVLTEVLEKLDPSATHVSAFYFRQEIETFQILKNENGQPGSCRASPTLTDLYRFNFDDLNGKRIKDVRCRLASIYIITDDELFLAMHVPVHKQADGLEPNKPVSLLKAEVVQIAIGKNHWACVTVEGDLFMWRDNDTGILSHYSNIPYPTKVSITEGTSTNPIKFKEIACNDDMTVLLDTSGRMVSLNHKTNPSNQSHIAIPSLQNGIDDSPKPVPQFENIPLKHIYCVEHGGTLAVGVDGSVYAWGLNYFFTLGVGHNRPVLEPTKLRTFEKDLVKVDHLLLGPNYVVAATNRGIYAWGILSLGILNSGLLCVSRVTDRATSYCIFPEPRPVPDEFSPLRIFYSQRRLTPGLISVNELARKKTKENADDDGGLLLSGALDDQETADFVIVVESRRIHVHKAILKIRSRHFRTMFASEEWKKNQANELNVDNTSYAIYRAYLCYLYTATFPRSLSIKDAFQLLHLVFSYCEDFEDIFQLNLNRLILKQGLTLENVLGTYFLAISQGNKYVEYECLEFVVGNLPQIVLTDSYKDLDPLRVKDLMTAVGNANLLLPKRQI